MITRKVSLKDIASKAGVSTTLVSYVLNNQNESRIKKETAQKIRDVASKLNYRTNQIAKCLKTKKSYTIGFIVADIANPFSASMARIIEDEADKLDYTVIIGSSDESENKSEKLINTLVNRQVDGLILSLPAHAEEQVKNLEKAKIPYVLLDRYFPGINSSYVALDNYHAALEAVEHLVKSGRKKIGMITYQSGLFHLQERKRGYMSALAQAGIAFDNKWLKEVSIDKNKHQIEKAINELRAADTAADAILFASNNIATCGLRHINNLSVRIPEQLALVSFDQTEMLDLFHAPVTFIRQPLQEMGEMAIKLLFEKIKQIKTTKEINMKGELIIRRSSSN